jgi:prevent-host-death family protein
MQRYVTSSEAQSNFGAMIQWAEDKGDEVIVQKHGKPAVVIISYSEYEEIQRLRETSRRQAVLDILASLRREVQAGGATPAAVEAYELAEFGPEVIRETLATDEEHEAKR